MRTFHEIYKKIANCEKTWCYYSNPTFCIKDAWLDKEEAYNFIIDYYTFGGKGKLFKNSKLNKELGSLEERASHTVSVYLLGIYLAKELNIQSIFIDNKSSNDANFLYLWFLTCLYHDYALMFENSGNIFNYMESFKNEYKLKYHSKNIFKPYNEFLVNLYFKHKDKPDHGIIGGLLLYNGLRENYYQAWVENKNNNKSKETYKDFSVFIDDRKLHFAKNHFRYYAKAASAIISHNIWISTLKDYIYEYNKNSTANDKIDVEKATKKIKFEKSNYLLFLLALADTLEPLKRFKGYDIKELFKNISIHVNEKTYKTTIKVIGNNIDTEDYFKRIIELSEWLNVTVTIEECINQCTIDILS